MSSRKFWATLVPDRRLRNGVLLSGVILTVGGLALILHMPLHVMLRSLLIVVWLACCCRELAALSMLASRVRCLRLNNAGEILAVSRQGHSAAVELLAGSVVLRRLAWLRIEFADGRCYAELVSARAVSEAQWHRFQLIWHQCRQFFGDQ